MQLPSEIQQYIRQYGYTPFISDQALYELIQDINPYFSIRDLYFRYTYWLNKLEDLKRSHYMIHRAIDIYEKILKDTKYDLRIEDDYITFNNVPREAFELLTHQWTIEENNLENGEVAYIINNEYLAKCLTVYLDHLRENPLSPTILTYYQSKLDFELDCNKLTHTLKYDPLDVTTLQLLQELEPKFSLQKELTKWQKIHKLKSQALDIIIKNRENIVRLLYDEESMIVSISLSVINDIQGLERDETGYGDYSIKSVTKEQFIATCLALWNGRRYYDMTYFDPIYNIPFINYL